MKSTVSIPNTRVTRQYTENIIKSDDWFIHRVNIFVIEMIKYKKTMASRQNRTEHLHETIRHDYASFVYGLGPERSTNTQPI